MWDGNTFEFLIVSKSESDKDYAREWHEHVKGIVSHTGVETPIRYELGEIIQKCSQKEVSFAKKEGTGSNDDISQLLSNEEFNSYLITSVDRKIILLQAIAEGVEIYTVPGNHYTMLRKPHVQILAEQLKACLNKV